MENLRWPSKGFLALLFFGAILARGCSVSRRSVDVTVCPDIETQKEAIKRIGIVAFLFDRPVTEQAAAGSVFSRPKDAGEMVADGISDIPMKLGYSVVERKQLKVLMDENGLTVTDLMKRETVAKLGKTLGADAVIMGTVPEFAHFSGPLNYARQISFNAKCVRLETGEIMWSVTAYMEGPEGYSEMLGSVCREAAEKLRKEGAAKGR